MILFLDEQNVYRSARRAFHHASASAADGNVDPVALGKLLEGRKPPSDTEERECLQVRLYTGLPAANREPRANVAHVRRIQAWQAAGAWVEARPLRYPFGWTPGSQPAQQKGVDVALALDVVMLAIDGAYDVGIVFSSDTDLRPALEFTLSHTNSAIETASWWSPTSVNRLSLPGVRTWNHRLTQADYASVVDRRSFSSP